MLKHIYEISVEIKPMPGCNMPNELLGAFVYCYVPAESLEDSLSIMKEALFEDRYELLEIEYCTKLNLDQWNPNDMHFPSAQQLRELDSGEIYYSPFYGYQSQYEH